MLVTGVLEANRTLVQASIVDRLLAFVTASFVHFPTLPAPVLRALSAADKVALLGITNGGVAQR